MFRSIVMAFWCFSSLSETLKYHTLFFVVHRYDSSSCTDECPQIILSENSPSQSNLALTPEPAGWVLIKTNYIDITDSIDLIRETHVIIHFVPFCLYGSEWTTCLHHQPFTSLYQEETASLCKGIAPHPLPMFIWSAQWTLLVSVSLRSALNALLFFDFL